MELTILRPLRGNANLAHMRAMVVSALVVTLPADPTRSREVLAELARDPRLTIGERVSDRVPVIAETSHAHEGAALFGRLERLPGVHVHCVAIQYGDDS
jgi:hypothetical protein